MFDEARLRQKSLLDGEPTPLPKEIEAKLLELLVELLLGVVDASDGDRVDE